MIDQVSRGLDHPACAARGAKTTPFARKRYEVLVQTAFALDAQEPVLEAAALQVVVELLLDERGQRAAFGFETGEKLGVVGLDDAVERRLFGPVPFIVGGRGG